MVPSFPEYHALKPIHTHIEIVIINNLYVHVCVYNIIVERSLFIITASIKRLLNRRPPTQQLHS